MSLLSACVLHYSLKMIIFWLGGVGFFLPLVSHMTSRFKTTHSLAESLNERVKQVINFFVAHLKVCVCASHYIHVIQTANFIVVTLRFYCRRILKTTLICICYASKWTRSRHSPKARDAFQSYHSCLVVRNLRSSRTKGGIGIDSWMNSTRLLLSSRMAKKNSARRMPYEQLRPSSEVEAI